MMSAARVFWKSRRFGQVAATCLGLMLIVAPALAQADAPVDNFADFFKRLDRCVRLPASAEGSELTLRFSLTREGAVRGKPMITFSKLMGDSQAQRDFVAAALRALANCTPAPVTEAFGRALGERMLTWRLRAVRQRDS